MFPPDVMADIQVNLDWVGTDKQAALDQLMETSGSMVASMNTMVWPRWSKDCETVWWYADVGRSPGMLFGKAWVKGPRDVEEKAMG